MDNQSGILKLSQQSGESQAPVLSVVVVAWNIAPFVAEAIASCFQLPERDMEVIIVENGSSDETRAAIEKAISGHDNARLVCNPTNTGLGPARNQGLALARGKYVCFLDGDDWFAANTLGRILTETMSQNADVAVFDHVRFTVSGKYTTRCNRAVLEREAKNEREARVNAATAFQVAWNKLYRRSFLQSHAFQFANSYYEDIDWTYPIIFSAPKVITVPLVGVVYRQRAGSILSTSSARHLEVIERMQSLLAKANANSELFDSDVRKFLAGRMTLQAFTILSSRHRISWPHKLQLAGEMQLVLRGLDPDFEFAAKKMKMRIVYHLLRQGWTKAAVLACQFLVKGDRQLA